MTKTYIGLDQALTKTGVAIAKLNFDEEGKAVGGNLMCGLLTTDSQDMCIDRLLDIRDFIWALVEGVNPEHLFTEMVYIQRTRASLDLIRVETAIHLVARQLEVPVTIMSASPKVTNSWPRLFGSGGTKGLTQEMVQQATGQYLTDHEADAIGILYGGLMTLGIAPPPLDNIPLTKLSFIGE